MRLCDLRLGRREFEEAHQVHRWTVATFGTWKAPVLIALRGQDWIIAADNVDISRAADLFAKFRGFPTLYPVAPSQRCNLEQHRLMRFGLSQTIRRKGRMRTPTDVQH